MHWRDTGFTRVHLRGNGVVSLLREDLDRLVSEWMAGNAYGTFTQMYGGKVVIRLGEVQGVQDVCPDGIKREDEDDRVDRLRELTDG